MALSEHETDSLRGDRLRIVRAAGIVSTAFVISRILGLVRDAVINFYFDIDSLEANAYFTANVFPETIFYIIAGGALGSAFIPTFSAYFVRNDRVGGWHLFSSIINLVIIAGTISAAAAAIFAPQLLRLFYPDLIATSPEILEMAVDLMRLLLLTVIVFGASGVVMAALNARQHFLLPAIAPIVYNLGIIAGAVILAPNVMGLALGAVAGSLGHLVIQLPGLRAQRAVYTPTFSLRDRGVRQVLALMAPRVVGLSFGQLNHLLMRAMAQGLVIGSIPALVFAWRIMIMPQGVIGQALAIAAFPTFSELAARRALSEMRRIVADTLRMIVFLSLPAAVLLIVLRVPVVSFLFERGQFDAQSTGFVSWALLYFAASLVGLAAIEIIARAFYALEDTLTPVLVGALQLASMWILGLWLSNSLFPALDWLALGGLALAYTVSTLVELLLLLGLLSRKMGGLNGRFLLDGVWRMSLAAIVLGAALWLILRQFSTSPAILQLAAGALAAALIYPALCLLLGVSEVRRLLELARERFRR